MVHIHYGFEKFEKSGKCGIRMKIQIRNSGKKNFLKFFFFNCEQFLLNTFLSKMIIYPKKMCFLPKKVCFLYFSCSPPSSTRPNCLYNLCCKSGQKIDQEFDFAQVRPLFFSGKKPDMKFPEFLDRYCYIFEHTLG